MCFSVYNNIHEMWNSYRPEKVDKQVEFLTFIMCYSVYNNMNSTSFNCVLHETCMIRCVQLSPDIFSKATLNVGYEIVITL